MLKINKLSKNYKDNIIFSDVSFEIKKGDVVSIVGKSGCGKSTLLRCLNRLEDVTSGTIYLNGKNINDFNKNELRQKIGLVFQNYNLFEHLTIIENLTIGLKKIKKIPNTQAEKLAISMLKRFGVEDKKNNYPDELSGGQQQRVAIIRTLLMKPQIILLDEPTSALDREMKHEVLKLINDLVKQNYTLIIVSHEEDFVNKISDKIIKLENGKANIITNKR